MYKVRRSRGITVCKPRFIYRPNLSSLLKNLNDIKRLKGYIIGMKKTEIL